MRSLVLDVRLLVAEEYNQCVDHPRVRPCAHFAECLDSFDSHEKPRVIEQCSEGRDDPRLRPCTHPGERPGGRQHHIRVMKKCDDDWKRGRN